MRSTRSRSIITAVLALVATGAGGSVAADAATERTTLTASKAAKKGCHTRYAGRSARTATLVRAPRQRRGWSRPA